jgi:hypothetical protein
MRVLAGTVFVLGVAVSTISSQSWVPSVPRAWDDEAVRTMELPLAGLGVPAHHVSSEYYYQTPTARIPKTYPVYAPGREPAGYLEWLKAQEPEDATTFSNLKTQEEWVRAGQLVFDGAFNPSAGPTAERIREFSGSPLYPRPAKAAVVTPGFWKTAR